MVTGRAAAGLDRVRRLADRADVFLDRQKLLVLGGVDEVPVDDA